MAWGTILASRGHALLPQVLFKIIALINQYDQLARKLPRRLEYLLLHIEELLQSFVELVFVEVGLVILIPIGSCKEVLQVLDAERIAFSVELPSQVKLITNTKLGNILKRIDDLFEVPLAIYIVE